LVATFTGGWQGNATLTCASHALANVEANLLPLPTTTATFVSVSWHSLNIDATLALDVAGLATPRLAGYRVLPKTTGNAKWILKCTKVGAASDVVNDARTDRDYALVANSYAEFALGAVSAEFDKVEFTNKSAASLEFRLQLVVI
jgi:hypothetical protein